MTKVYIYTLLLFFNYISIVSDTLSTNITSNTIPNTIPNSKHKQACKSKSIHNKFLSQKKSLPNKYNVTGKRILPLHTALVIMTCIAIKQSYNKLSTATKPLITSFFPDKAIKEAEEYHSSIRSFFGSYIALSESIETHKNKEQNLEVYKLEQLIKELYTYSCLKPFDKFIEHIEKEIIPKLDTYMITIYKHKDTHAQAANLYKSLQLLTDKLFLVAHTIKILPSYKNQHEDRS